MPGLLVVFSGLPGVGKSTLARTLAEELGAVWLRIDSIEAAIRASGVVPGSLEDAGYRAGYALAADNLRLGRTVVADSVNPWMLTRDAWRQAGEGAGAKVLEIEVVCTDQVEHRRRVETRVDETPGLVLPGWAEVLARDYRPWERPRLLIDTGRVGVAAGLATIVAQIAAAAP